jgi:hypothetical protein
MARPGFFVRYNADGYEVEFADTKEGRERAQKRGFTFTENPKVPKAEADKPAKVK